MANLEHSSHFLGVKIDPGFPREKIDRLHRRAGMNRILKDAYKAGARVVMRTARQRNYGFDDRTLDQRFKTSKVLNYDDHFKRMNADIVKKVSAGLRKSIVIVSKNYKGRADVFVVANHPLAYVVERGHGGPKPAAPHPFLGKAAKEKSGAVMAAIAARLPGAIKKELTRKSTGYRRPPSRFGPKR